MNGKYILESQKTEFCRSLRESLNQEKQLFDAHFNSDLTFTIILPIGNLF